MLGYLEKYNQLSQEIRDKVSTPAIMSAIDDLEKKYGVDLAPTIMKVMVKDIDLNNVLQMQKELSIDEVTVLDLVGELKEQIFSEVADYLGLIKKVSEVALTQSSQAKEKPKVMSDEIRKNANLFFSSEDEREIMELSKVAGKIDLQPAIKISDQLDNIIAKLQINFGSDDLRNRFRQIMETYLKGIRSSVETKQALIKSFESGGLGFDEESVDKIVAIANDNSKNIGEIKIKVPEKIKTLDTEEEKIASLRQSGIRDVEYDLASELKKKEKETQKQKNTEIDVSHELAPPPPAKIITPHKIKITEPKNTMPVPSETKKAETQKTQKTIIKPDFSIKPKARIVQRKEGKIKMEDVKQMPKVMSPIDELKYMDLTNFRRLGETPEAIIEEIKERLLLLENDNYAKRLEGVKAWRNSPVNKLYLSIGQASISENKAIDDIIEEQKKQNKEILTNQEFKAIMDLNRSLRF